MVVIGALRGATFYTLRISNICSTITTIDAALKGDGVMRENEVVEYLQQDIATSIFYVNCYELLELISELITNFLEER